MKNAVKGMFAILSNVRCAALARINKKKFLNII